MATQAASTKAVSLYFFPIINLSGKWLQELGFRSGQVIDIECASGKRIITLSKEQRFEGMG